MQSIILIGDERFNLDFIKNLPKSVDTCSHEPNDSRYVLEYVNDRIYYDYLSEGILDYEKSELLHLPFRSPRFIAMLYTSNEIMRDFFLENVKYLEVDIFTKVIKCFLEDYFKNLLNISKYKEEVELSYHLFLKEF